MTGKSRIPGKKIRLTSQKPVDRDELAFLISSDVKYTACSLEQLRIFGEYLPGGQLGVRFNIGIGSGWTPHTATGGKNSSFGIPYEKKKYVDHLLSNSNLVLDTIHFHIGSGSDPEKQRQAINKGLEIVEEYPDVETLNIGGGFKIAGMNYEKATDIEEMGRVITQSVTNFSRKTGRNIHLEVEPGTALVGNAGYILTRVIDKKDTNPGGEEFLILDGGINMVDRTERYGAQHPLVVIPITEGQRGIKEYVVMGPCCESGDVVTVRPGNSGMIDPRRMGEAFIGDLVAICRGGAYCSSMAGGNYNSQPLHREILARINKDIQEIRLEQHLSDLSQYEIVPEDLRRK
jgi:diaminopimelate decarboxylase